MSKLTLNNIPHSVFAVNANDVQDGTSKRADIVAMGRVLAYDYAARGANAVREGLKKSEKIDRTITTSQYKQMNEKFQHDHLLYAASKVAALNDTVAPSNYDEFKRNAQNYFTNSQFWAVLQGIYQEIITPILPAVYSEAVSVFADVVEVGFGETYALSIDSNFIPIFQDSAWGASRSVPRNRFYSRDITLNPTPRSAWITAKYMQLIGNGMDFGRFFANIAAGMYSKTMALWASAMTQAAANTSLVPSGLQYTFSTPNWVSAANKVSALNSTPVSNLIAIGGLPALSKVLPTTVTGSTNVNMDAAIATLLGADYTRSGYLGEFMAVRLMPILDAVVPGTQNGEVQTILDQSKIWLMASTGYKPLVIAYNSDTPITIEMQPDKSADFEIGINLTMAIDSVAVFASRAALLTV